MSTTILKETFDKNLNCLLRLKLLESNQTITTIRVVELTGCGANAASNLFCA